MPVERERPRREELPPELDSDIGEPRAEPFGRNAADSVLELTPDLVGPSITKNQGLIGECVDLTLAHLNDMRPSTVLYHLTARLLFTRLAVGSGVIRGSADVDRNEKSHDSNIRHSDTNGIFRGCRLGRRSPTLCPYLVFAHHPIMDESADHRDPRQWRFHVVATGRLPIDKTISLVKVALLSERRFLVH